jgi:formate/nitrite transporter FocA (FNT family)
MKIKAIIFSGIMTALVGAMIGTAVSYIAQKKERQKVIIITGATLGFVIGSMQHAVREEKKKRKDEYGD